MKIRTNCPSNNKYYIRQVSGGLNGAVKGQPTQKGADVLDNCVGYANGRFNEIWNDPELKGIVKAFHVQLVCNAENFIESAKKQGLKISSTPIEGGIMVWQKGKTLSGGDGAGHVAVVEEVYADGSIMTSESGWASWAFKLVRRDNSNGRWGQGSAYKFRGCIINPGITDPKVVPAPKLVVDGIAGSLTVTAAQVLFNTPADGEYSRQRKDLIKKWCPSLTAVTYGGGGSVGIKAIQKWLGISDDGVWGKDTSKALQNALILMGYDVGDSGADGIFGKDSMKAFQRFLNEHDTLPPSPKRSVENLVIDVSEFQSDINWNKVKAAGIKGVIVRCGYRGYEKGTLKEDSMFLKHIHGAQAAGLKLGVYFFTEAINYKEGIAEAQYTLSLIQKAGVSLQYPIAIDTEAISGGKGRADKISVEKRTEAIQGFCSEIQRQDGRPMIYASTSWLNNKLDMNILPYDVWVAQYYSKCEYKGRYVMWQYTSEGSVNGVKGKVDMNRCYLEG